LVLTNTVDLQLFCKTHLDPEARAASVASTADQLGVRVAEVVVFDPAERKKELAKHLLAHKFIQAMVEKAAVLTACYLQGVVPRITEQQQSALCEMTACRYGGNDVASAPTTKGSGSHEQAKASVSMHQPECEIAAPFRYQ
jgi:hypothetical protein